MGRLRGTVLTGLAVRHAEALVLAALVLFFAVLHVLPAQAPFPVDLLALAAGTTVAMQAMGIVIVYRSSRIINFAQIPLGAVGGLLFAELVYHQSLVRGLGALCSCVQVDESKVLRSSGAAAITGVSPGVADVLGQLNYWISALLAFGAVLLISWLIYWLIVRRFSRAPRLILTVVTVGLSEVFLLAGGLIADAWQRASPSTPLTLSAPLPFDWKISLPPAVFHAQDLLSVALLGVLVMALGFYLHRRRAGIALRGVAENADRAATLGVPVSSVTSRAWLIAGALSGVAGLLAAIGGVSAPDSSVQVLSITAAVIGGLFSLPLAAAAALVLTLVQSSVLWAYHSANFFDGFLLLIVAGVLLVQRRREGRSDTETTDIWSGTREARPIPRELRGQSTVRRAVFWSTVIGGGALLGLPWLLSTGQTNTATVILTYAVVGLSLLILTGWAGQISLGQFAFAGVGAFMAALLHLPLPLQVVVSGIAGSIVAVAVGVPALRLRGLQLAVTTLALALAVQSLLVNPAYLGKYSGGSLIRPSVFGVDFNDERSFFYLVLCFLVLTVLATMGLRRSRTARALIAARDNEPLAQAYGINLVRARLLAFALAGFLAAVAGVLFAYTEGSVNSASYTTDVSLVMFLMVVIGGLGSIAGPLIGALYIGALDLFLPPIWQQAGTGVVAVALLMFAPGGLSQIMYGLRDAFLRRIAERNRISVPSLFGDRLHDSDRTRLAPKARRGGGTIFVPDRYRMHGQWAIRRSRS